MLIQRRYAGRRDAIIEEERAARAVLVVHRDVKGQRVAHGELRRNTREVGARANHVVRFLDLCELS